MKLQFIIIFAFVAVVNNFQAQVFEPNGEQFEINGSYYFPRAFAVDAYGNTYGTVKSDYSVSFEGGQISPAGEIKIFKHDKYGNLIWQTAGGTYCSIKEIQIDGAGNIYVAGYQAAGLITASNCLDYNSSTYNYADFIAKLNPDGTFAWLTEVPGPCSIATTSGGNVGFVTVINPTSGNSPYMLDNIVVTNYYKHIMYGELDSNGDVNWYNITPNPLPNGLWSVYGAAYNNGKLYFYGYYNGTFDFGGYSLTLNNVCSSWTYEYDMYIAEVDWASHAVVNVNQTNNMVVKKIAFDMNNNLIFALQHATVGGSCAQDGSFMGLNFTVSADGHIVKVDPQYNVLASHDLGGVHQPLISPDVFVTDIVSKGSDVFVAFQNRGYFGGQFFVDTSATNTSYPGHMYLMRLDENLNYKYHSVFEADVLSVPRSMQLGQNNGYLSVMANSESPTYTGPFLHSWFINSYISNANIVEGIVFRDFNYNNQYDAGDTPYTGSFVEVTPSAYSVITNANGQFRAYLDSGTYQFSVPVIPMYYNAAQPLTEITFNGNNITSTVEVPIVPTPNINDIEIEFFAEGPIVLVEPTIHHVVVENVGTTIQDVNVSISPLNLPYGVGDIVASSGLTLSGGNYETTIVGMQPGDTAHYTITYYTPISFLLNVGDIGATAAAITTTNTDVTPLNNSQSFSQTVLASYDPNIKIVQEPFNLDYYNLDDLDYIHYTIHFQNEGNYPATNVRISDEIEDDLVLESIRIIHASDSVYATIQNRTIHFHFDSIMLVAKSVDEFESRGYVHFKLKRDSALTLGDSIINRAEIYFDFNPAIITNDAENIVVDDVSVTELINKPSLILYPNPAVDQFTLLNFPKNVHEIIFYDQLGSIVMTVAVAPNENGSVLLPFSGIAPGTYIMKIGTIINKVVIQ